ncbi:MAG TPA: cytochrome c [Ramlibacter sp.]|nr:cytochrome c [Ramlibacter sp.]
MQSATSPALHGRAQQIYALPGGCCDPSTAKGAIIASKPRCRASVLWIVLFASSLLAVAGCAALGQHGAINPVATPAPAMFDPLLVRRGELLAVLGDCAGCHTTRDGAPYAGGVPIATPFGTIHGTNITPEPEAGIGAWSEAAFRRALREGVSRDGHLLYPAFPYDHFTHLTDADIGALYAFVMTRDPVSSQPPANRLPFPMQFRSLIAFWNMLYLHEGPLPQQESRSAEFNRGAYLVESLAHCASCHSPRNALGAERQDAYLAGGDAEGWHATALNDRSPSPVPWTAQALAEYLRTGLAADHAIAAGPMRDVVYNLSHADAAEVQAIATYIHAQMTPLTPQGQAREAASRRRAAQESLAAAQPSAAAAAADEAVLALGAAVYATSCAACHDLGRELSSNTALRLPLAVALHLPDPRNLIHITRRGIEPPDGGPGRWMPPFEGSFTDEQFAALVTWLRRQGTDAPPWPDVLRTVKESGNAS